MAVRGACRCGAVQYEIAIEGPPRVYACHCGACQRWSGSAFTEQAPVPLEALQLSGELLTFSYQTPSGAKSTHQACAKCFSRIFNVNERLPAWAILRAGTLDDSPATEVIAHIWVSRKQPWIEIPDDIPIFQENAPTAEFVKLLGLADGPASAAVGT